MADFTIASRIGQGLGQNAFAGGGSQMNPLNMMQLMQTMELQRAAEQRALAGEARAQALHGPALTAAQQRIEAGGLELTKAKREMADIETADKAIKFVADNPDWFTKYNDLRKSDSKLWSNLDELAKKKTAADLAATKDRLKFDEERFGFNKKLAENMAATAPLVKDQASYERWLKPLMANNEEVAGKIPIEYSPENLATAKNVIDRLRRFEIIKTDTGEQVVWDPVEKRNMGMMTNEGLKPFDRPILTPTGAPTGTPTGAQPRAAAPLSPEAATMTTNALRRFEGFREKPYWDVDAYRTGYGSDTITTPEGRVVKVQPGMTVTREDAERDLARRRTEFASTAARQAGETWGNLPPGAHAGLTSVAYNYGSLPSRILGAVRSGDTEAIARAVEGLAMDNNGINYARRMQEAAMIRGQAMPAAAGSPAVSASIGATERGMMGQPQAPANAMAPLFAAQLMQQQNAMAAQPQALPNIAPGLTQADAPLPAASVAAANLSPAQQSRVAEAAAKKQAEADVARREELRDRERAQANVDKTLVKMADAYEKLRELGGMASEEDTLAESAPAYLASTRLGQEVSKFTATKAQTQRDRVTALVRTLITDLKNASGMSAQELNSIKELELMLAASTNPTQSIEAVRAILQDTADRYGSGIKIPVKTGKTEEPPRSRGAAGETPRQLAPRDQEALDWANANPRDPRAAEIKQRLGVR